VTWDWGASRAGNYTILYGRVLGPKQLGMNTPLLVYLVDSLGFRSVFRPKVIAYDDNRVITVDGRAVRVPARAVFTDTRGADSLRVDLSIEDAIGTDQRLQSPGGAPFREDKGDKNSGDLPGGTGERPYFIQMKGTARISGRAGGAPISGTGSGFFETYR
jgi:hypothetical protein